jgi:hypothetical protein
MPIVWRASCGTALAGCVIALVATARPLVADEPVAATGAADTLARQEADLLRQYRELERSFLRLADLLAASDPRRAAVLRDAFEQAREAEVGDRLARIVELLEKGQLLAAGTGQAAAVDQFRGLLDLLEEGGRQRNRADTRQAVKQFLSRVTKLIARQRDIEGSTEAGAAEEPLAERQQDAAAEAADLADELDRFARRLDDTPRPDKQATAGNRTPAGKRDAEPAGEEKAGEPAGEQARNAQGKQTEGQQAGEQGEQGQQGQQGQQAGEQGEQGQQGQQGQQAGEQGDEQGDHAGEEAGEEAGEQAEPTGDDEVSRARRTRRRLQAAERRMQEAERRLSEAERKAARDEQQRAIEELETARAELEEILRQMREEEVERLLVQLETRVRTMLKAQRQILAGSEQLVAAEAASRRERQLESARLGRAQEEVTAEADRAVMLVRDDGSAVAIPEALGQIRDDSAQVAARLKRGDLAPATLGIAGDIVTGLEELLAALEKSRGDNDERPQQAGPGGGRPAEPGQQPLVDKLAELKMLRSLQARVNTRTDRFAALLDEGVEQAVEAELAAALGRLSERQRAIERAARDIVTGRTEP